MCACIIDDIDCSEIDMPKVNLAEIEARLAAKNIEIVEYCGSVRGGNTLFRCKLDGYEWRASVDNVGRRTGCPMCSGSQRVTEVVARTRLVGRPIELVEYCGTANEHSKFRCTDCGHEWVTSFTAVDSMGSGCPECAATRALSRDEVVSRLVGTDIELVDYAGTAGGKSKFRCLKPGCDHEWVTSFRIIQSEGTGCKKCAGLLPLSVDEVTTRLLGRPVELVSYAGTASAKSVFRCKNSGCGYEWRATFNAVHHQQQGCPKCAGVLKIEESEAVARLSGKHVRMVKYSSVSDKCEFECTVPGCGHIWETTYRSVFVSRGNGCPKCAGILVITETEARKRAHFANVDILSYGGSSTAMSLFKCRVDGHEWSTSLSSLRGCPKCAGNLPITDDDVRSRLVGRDITLVSYGGCVDAQSTFNCGKCGRDWEATVDRVTGKQRSGCPSCAETGFKPNLVADFYVYEIADASSKYVGFGISNEFELRNYHHNLAFSKSNATATLLNTYNMDGHIAQRFEKLVKQNFPIVDTGIPGFRTEAFEYDEELLALLKLGAEHGAKISQTV